MLHYLSIVKLFLFKYLISTNLPTSRCQDMDIVQKCFEAEKEKVQTRAGHLRYFLIFSITKNYFLHFLSS